VSFYGTYTANKVIGWLQCRKDCGVFSVETAKYFASILQRKFPGAKTDAYTVDDDAGDGMTVGYNQRIHQR
jgi:hypothetical protein